MLTLSRNLSLFVHTQPTDLRAAMFLSLVSSAVRNDLDVWAYVKIAEANTSHSEKLFYLAPAKINMVPMGTHAVSPL